MAAVATAPAGTSPRWIVSRSVDLSLVIGSVVAGYIYLGLYTALHVKITLLWWFWSVGFDGTHIFATASRTYFDKDARARDPKLLYGSLLVFFSIGPLMVLAGQKGLLALLVGVWAYYHVIRQHYGFLVLYKVKNRDLLQPNGPDERVQKEILRLYKDSPECSILFELMTDFDEGLQEWRYRHVKLVERTIGAKKGTGGSPGVPFLKESLFRPVFHDLWAIRHEM